MAIVLDIESYGTPADLPSGLLERLAERAARRGESPPPGDTADTLSLHPFLGRVLCIGVKVDDADVTVLYVGPSPSTPTTAKLVAYRSEADMLRAFWSALGMRAPVVTFNGRAFDLPFLMLRSARLGIRPTRNLVGYRFSLRSECDLAEALTFYGAIRRPSLEVACAAFGIASPKQGIDGSQVADAYDDGRIVEIAEYCARDVDATAALYGAIAGTLLPVLMAGRDP